MTPMQMAVLMRVNRLSPVVAASRWQIRHEPADHRTGPNSQHGRPNSRTTDPRCRESAAGTRASNIDTVTLTAGAAVVVTLAASSASAIPGDSLGFTATVRNSGTGIASPAAISLNGAPASLFVLRVPVPPNVVFASAQTLPSADVQVLYHLLGSPADSYVTNLPVGAVVDAVAWGVASLAPGAILQGQFTVIVNANAAGMITGTAYAGWTDQGARLSSTSNTVVLPPA